MTEKQTKQRSGDLAIENVKRIADLLRTERNDAIALAQVRREEVVKGRKLLQEARALLEESQASVPGDLKQKIATFIAGFPQEGAH